MRQRDKNGCGIYLRYQQYIPGAAGAAAAAAAAAQDAAAAGDTAAAAAGDTAATEQQQQQGDYLTLFFPENSTQEEIKLQIIKYINPKP